MAGELTSPRRGTPARPLLATLGASPLPLVLSIAALRPPRVRLVCSPGSVEITGLVQRGAREALGTDAPQFDEPCFVDEADDPEGILRRVRPVGDLGGYDLDYTGGTKAMSVATYTAWSGADGGGTAWHASERDDELIPDDGQSVALGSGLAAPLSLDTLARLNGHNGATGQQVQAFTQPAAGYTAAYVAGLVQLLDAAARPSSPGTTFPNVTLTIAAGQALTLDVVHLRGGAVFALAVLEQKLENADRKRHLFQAVRRAEQLGGPGSRAALVAPIPEADVQRLENEVSGELPVRLLRGGGRIRNLAALLVQHRPGRVTAFGSDDLAAAVRTPKNNRLVQWLED